MKKILIIIWISFIYFFSYGQINIGGKPYSFQHQIKPIKITKNNIQKVEVCELDFSRLTEEDRYNDSIGKPFRYGKLIEVAYNTQNSGEWIELENGDRIWILEIHCPSAKSINLAYDKFWLPVGGLLYIYTKDKHSFIGGFNYKNNKGTHENPSKYATGLLFSDDIYLEYYEPKKVSGEGIISISKIIYGYKDICSLESELCTVDINCSPEGDLWQDEKTSVALVISNGAVFSGSLMKNTKGNGIPYFLCANHSMEDNGLDAISDPDASDFLFWWDYEFENCNGSTYSYQETTGATLVANNSSSDFALLRLLESPYDLSPPYQAYFNGWDRRSPGNGNICIHHPQFLPKKISTDNHPPTTSDNNYWAVVWDQTTNGYSIVYPGSSGAPLYNVYRNNNIIGQLSKRVGDYCPHQKSKFGKFSISWGNGSEHRRRLKEWLDPDNSNVQYLNGSYCTNTEYIFNTKLEDDAVIYGCAINLQNVTINNGANIVFHSYSDLIINGEFEIELGSTMEIQ